MQNAVSTDKGFARIPSLDELAAQYTSSKDLSSLLKDTQVPSHSLTGLQLYHHLGIKLTAGCVGCRQL